MLMKKDDHFFIAGRFIDDPKKLAVFSRFNTHGMEWPVNIKHNSKEYTYVGLEPMPNEYVGHYFSLAGYMEI